VRESKIEKHLVLQIKKRGGICLKFISPSMIGVPDRLCLLPKGIIFFAELKATGEKPRPSQEFVINLLRKLGQSVEVFDSKEQIDEFLRELHKENL
jgi:hypothetical protein